MRSLKIFMLVSVVLSTAALAGCGNTLHGMGQDIENIGQTMKETF